MSEGDEASLMVFDRWLSKASENIDQWGLQDEETLLLATQEELGELTQAHLEAKHADGDPRRVDEELVDLGALLFQLSEARNVPEVRAGTEQVGQFERDEMNTQFVVTAHPVSITLGRGSQC